MGTYPNTRPEFLNWAESHVAPWTANTAAVGLAAGAFVSWKNSVTDYRTKFNAQEAARQAYRAATNDANVAYTLCRSLTGEAVRTIRAFAGTNNNPNVYSLAQIPPPAVPGPVPPPAQPVMVNAVLNAQSGALTIKWKATNPASGTTYLVRRKLPGQTEFTLIGATGGKSVLDATVPSGIASVQYIVQGQRSTEVGAPSETLTVNFGVAGGGGGGMAILSMTHEPTASDVKLAA